MKKHYPKHYTLCWGECDPIGPLTAAMFIAADQSASISPQDIAMRNASVDKQLTSRQMASVDVIGDGNCLFCSVVACLYGDQLRHAQLRAAIVLLMKSRVEAGCQLSGDTAAARRRIGKIATGDNWVREDVILAIADYLQRQICVFFASDTALPLTNLPTASDTYDIVNDRIRIAFYEPGHFRAVEECMF